MNFATSKYGWMSGWVMTELAAYPIVRKCKGKLA